MKLWIAFVIVAALIAAKVPLDSADAHRRSDAVLFPRFVAAMNEYSQQHGSREVQGHFLTLNASDVKRWRAARDAWKELDEAMKQAGY